MDEILEVLLDYLKMLLFAPFFAAAALILGVVLYGTMLLLSALGFYVLDYFGAFQSILEASGQ